MCYPVLIAVNGKCVIKVIMTSSVFDLEIKKLFSYKLRLKAEFTQTNTKPLFLNEASV